jgi:hypothetical protein
MISPAWPSKSVPESISLGDRDDQQTQVALVDRHTAQPVQTGVITRLLIGDHGRGIAYHSK